MPLILGFLFMLFMFAGIGKLSDNMLSIFIDLPSALLILVALLFFLLVSKSGGVIRKYAAASFKKDYTYTRTELEALALAIKNTIKFTLAAGVFGFMTGLIACLTYLGAPERLGKTLAITLISFIYAISVSFFVFFPTQAWAENKIKALKNDA